MEKKSNSQAVSDFRRRRKENLLKVAGDKCNICNYSKAISALEFHHIDPTKKEYSIASKGTCHNIQQDLLEVQKCILVCANCHREIHEGLYSNEFLLEKQIYDEDYAKTLTTLKKDITINCSKCGAQIARDTLTGLCGKCARLASRKCEHPTREELKELLQKYSFTELGRMYGVSDNSVRKWCIKYNLPHRKRDIDLVQNWSEI